MFFSLRGQIVLEFIMFTVLALFLVLVLIALALRISSSIASDQGVSEVTDLARSVQEELILASQVSEGYHRSFVLPTRLQRGEYSITNSEELLTLSYDSATVSLAIPLVNGTLQKGANVIIHENETIYINP